MANGVSDWAETAIDWAIRVLCVIAICLGALLAHWVGEIGGQEKVADRYCKDAGHTHGTWFEAESRIVCIDRSEIKSGVVPK